MTVSSLFPQMDFSLYARTPGVSFFHKDTSPVGFGPALITSLNINFLFKSLISKYSSIGGQDFNIWIFRKHKWVHDRTNGI